MQFRNAMLAALLMTALAGAASAQTDSHTHPSAAHSDKAASKAEDAKPSITAKELKQRLDGGEKITIIDARSSLGGQIIKGALQVPMDKLEDWAKDVDKNAIIVTYCTCPHDEAADAEVRKLREMGFKNAYALSGGLDAARSGGFEIVTPADK